MYRSTQKNCKKTAYTVGLSLHFTLEQSDNQCSTFRFSVHPCDTAKKGGCEDKCLKNGDGVKCACSNKTEELAIDGMSCKFIHPCEKNKGDCEQLCKRKGNDRYCACKETFVLNQDGKTCKKLHPCDVKVGKSKNGGCSQTCTKVRIISVL